MTHIDVPAPMLRFDAIRGDPSLQMPPVSRGRRLATLIPHWATPGRSFALSAALYLLLCAVAFFVVRPTTQLYFTDYWEHRAIVDEVVRHGLQPIDPIYGEGASSRQYTPWSLALGWLARVGAIDSDTVMAWGAMLVSLLFVVGVQQFARAFYAHRWAPVLLFVVLTCAWGLPALIWTGFYALRSQLHGNYYPAALVFALMFIAWASMLRLLKRDRFALTEAMMLSLVIAFSVITHPLNAAFLVAGAAGFALLQPGIAGSRRITAGMVIAVGIAVTIFWPYFNPLSLAGAGLARGQATFNNFHFFFDPLFVITLVWPGLFGLLALRSLIRDSRMRVPVLGLILTFLAYVVGGIADVSVSHRLLAYVVLMLQLVLVRALLDTMDGHPPGAMDELTPRAWRGVSVVATLLVAGQIAMAVEQLINPWANMLYNDRPRAVDHDTRGVVATFSPGARILGWESAALVMPSHGILVVAFPRPMPLSPSDGARQADYRRFFARATPTCRRLAIARHWGASHIAYLTNELDRRVQRKLMALGPAYSPVAPWRLIRIPGPEMKAC